MDIHVVKSGDTLYSIALQHGVPMSQLILDNQLPEPDRLVVGQAIVIQYPEQTYTVQAGDTLFSIAAAHQTTVRQLLRDNPALGGVRWVYCVDGANYPQSPRDGIVLDISLEELVY